MVKRIPYQAITDEVWEGGRIRLQNPMQDRPWVDAAVETFCDGQADVIIVGEEHDPDGFAVICGSRDWGSGKRFLGDSVTSESTGILARNEQALTKLAKGIVDMKRAVNFGHYPIGDGLVEKLRQVAGRQAFVVTKRSPQRAWPTLLLDGGWQKIEKSMSRSKRQSIARKKRKAEQIGPVRTEILSPTPEQCDELVQTAFEVQAKSWKGRAGTATIDNPVEVRFFRSFAQRAAELNQFRLAFLYVGDAIAAMQICTEWGESIWSISIGYDEEFAKYSPGELLTYDLVKWAAEQGLRTFEFCGKEAAWTRSWTNDATEVATVRLYPLNAHGMATLADHLRQKVLKSISNSWRIR